MWGLNLLSFSVYLSLSVRTLSLCIRKHMKFIRYVYSFELNNFKPMNINIVDGNYEQNDAWVKSIHNCAIELNKNKIIHFLNVLGWHKNDRGWFKHKKICCFFHARLCMCISVSMMLQNGMTQRPTHIHTEWGDPQTNQETLFGWCTP